MKIDTLIFGGCSTKIPTYIGIFKALIDLHIIDEKLQGIKHIISCSIGLLVSLYLLLEVNLQVQELSVLEADFSKLINIDDLNINNLIFKLGLFDNYLVPTLIKGVLQEKYKKDDMTLKELYEINPILVTVKCINLTKGCNEYINVKTDPDLSILTLLQMTTAIPIFFRPITYNNCQYVDGGLTGGYPIELVKDDYLGFNINGSFNFSSNELFDSIPILPFIISLLKINVRNIEDTCKIKTIEYETDLHFTEFNVPKDKKIELIKLGYDKTIQHIQQYNLTNDNLTESSKPDEDISPTEED
jgi:predicted acylesterase/phospholipase RssA